MAPKRWGSRLGVREELGLVKKDEPKPGAKQEAKAKSPAVKSLVGLYAKGKISARDVGDISSSAASSFEGPAPADLKRIAKAKAGPDPKKASRHSSRTLMRALAPSIELPPEYIAKCPMWNKKHIEPRSEDLAFLPPHEVLASLCTGDNIDKFTSYSDEQKGFKDELDDWGNRMEVETDGGNWLTLGLWGDTAPSTRGDSVMLLSLTVLCGIVRQRLWITTMKKNRICRCGCKGLHTFEAIFKVVAWSAKALILGQYPKADHEDKPFTTGWRKEQAGKPLGIHGCFIAKYGDWAWFKQALGLRGWSGEGPLGKVCWLCPASLYDPDNYAYDFRSTAPWRCRPTSMSDFWQQAFQERRHISPIWSIPGFLTRYCIPDFMHVCCLGILQYLNGNVMWEVFVGLGGTEARWVKACGVLENMVRVAAKAMKMDPPFANLTIGMMLPTQKRPKLKLKAAEGRYFLRVLEYLLRELVPAATAHEVLRLQCVQALLKVYAELDSWKTDGSSSATVSEWGRRHLLLYRELHDARTSDRFWRVYPKHHLFCHVTGRVRANPKLEWNYADESEIGLGAAVARAVNQEYLETALIRRYRATFSSNF